MTIRGHPVVVAHREPVGTESKKAIDCLHYDSDYKVTIFCGVSREDKAVILIDTRQYSGSAHLSACREGHVILQCNADTPHTTLFPWRAALQRGHRHELTVCRFPGHLRPVRRAIV